MVPSDANSYQTGDAFSKPVLMNSRPVAEAGGRGAERVFWRAAAFVEAEEAESDAAKLVAVVCASAAGNASIATI